MGVIVLCYHKVGPVKEVGRWLNVEPQTLRAHIRYFLRRRHRIVPASELDLALSNQVVLTFDDCYQSTLDFGLPVLVEENVQATFFAVSDRVGGESEWDSRQAAPLCGWSDLLRARDLGMEIGNHTATHMDLSATSLEEIEQEWKQCHQTLKEHGLVPLTACYPFGKGDSEASHKILEGLGYRYGFALKKRVATSSDGAFSIPRIIVSCGDRLPMLLYKIHLQPKIRRNKTV